MTCYHPLKAYRSREKNPATGRYLVTFNPVKSLVEGSSLSVPCGRCIGCRIDRSRTWAMRCLHEAQLHQENCFITLTYDEQHVPTNYSVDARDLQLFFKRLRKSLPGVTVRYFAAGEYGDQTLRPHYHSLIFGYSFPDRKLHAERNGNQTYKSEHLFKLWPYGFSEIGNLTYQSAAYVARYCIKKVNGDRADDHYSRVSPIDGQAYRVEPEFCLMSRRPGIGSSWLSKYAADVFPSDFLIVDGKRHKVPRFYTQRATEEVQKAVKRARKRAGLKNKANATPERLAVREYIQTERANRLKRSL